MGMVRPSGGHTDRMLEPGGWPDTDEDVLYDRAGRFGDVLREVTHVLETSREQRTQVFDGGIWTGSAADSAAGTLDSRIGQLSTLQDDVAGAISWHEQVAGSVVIAKTYIGENVETAHQRIAVIEGNATLTDAERTAAIEAVVVTALGANVGIVADVAAQIQSAAASQPSWSSWDTPSTTTPPLVVQPGSGNGTVPSTPSGPPAPTPTPGPGNTVPVPANPAPANPPAHKEDPTPTTKPTTPSGGQPAPIPVAPVTPNPVNPVTPVNPSPVTPVPTKPDVKPDPSATEPAKPAAGGWTPGSLPTMPSMPSVPSTPGAGIPQGPTPSAPVGPDGEFVRDTDEFDQDERDTAGRDDTATTDAEVGAAAAGPLDTSAVAPLQDTAATQPADAGEYGRGVTAASTVAAPAASVRSDDGVSPAAPMAPGGGAGAGAGAGGGMMPPPAGGGGGSGRGRGPAAPMSSRPLDPHPTSRARERPARPAAASAGRAEQSDRKRDPDVPAVAAVIPVSAARAVRDAIADASAAEAKRRDATPDPLQIGRRIAAALNAPDCEPPFALGFFWVTAVTADGDVVVANSYGLAYIPDGVELPEPVLLATADDSIPVADRAQWVTYPVRAVTAWAAHHGKAIRAVFGTEEQFAGADSGSTQIVLAADDIPETGAMSGRSRLAVVSADAATELAETVDLELGQLLPEASADPQEAPEDRRDDLWFDVMKPMASKASGREIAHLREFRGFADHCRELALAAATAAVEPAPRREAIADWRYWTHVTDLTDSALTPPA